MLRHKRKLDLLLDGLFLDTKSAVILSTLDSHWHPLTHSLMASFSTSSSDILGFCQPAYHASQRM